jgi:hypothetical protein
MTRRHCLRSRAPPGVPRERIVAAILAALLVTIGVPTAAVALTASCDCRRSPPNHQTSEQHFVLKPAAGVCHNDEWARKGDDKLVSTGTTSSNSSVSVSSGDSAARSATDPATQTGPP